MTNSEKNSINGGITKKYTLLFFLKGVKRVTHNIFLIISSAIYIILLFIGWKYRLNIFPIPNLFTAMFSDIYSFAYVVLTTAVTFIILVLLGLPKRFFIIKKNIRLIGLVNSADLSPILVNSYIDDENKRVMILEFESLGIPLSVWKDNQEKIGCALKYNVVSIEQGGNISLIIMRVIPSKRPWPKKLVWKENYLSNASFELVFGEGLAGVVTINLAIIPHLIIGGITGSGKSILLKLLLLQCILKDATVYIADFKGGVDFSRQWDSICTMVFDENSLLVILNNIVEQLEERKILLRDAECPNIDEYNKKTGANLKRIIFACDEVAEITNFGLKKEAKEAASKIEGFLSVIARQGRAMGIHLILATQRPDASVLSGQIKSNCDCICGRASNTLSIILLDNADANDLIPKNAQGRFLMRDGTVFQAYWFDEDKYFEEHKEVVKYVQ